MTELPDVARRTVLAWGRIEVWLGEHAAASHATLLPGASKGELDQLQEALGEGVPLPAELRAFWSRCAGQRIAEDVLHPDGYRIHARWNGCLPNYSWKLLTLAEVGEFYRERMEVEPVFWGWPGCSSGSSRRPSQHPSRPVPVTRGRGPPGTGRGGQRTR